MNHQDTSSYLHHIQEDLDERIKFRQQLLEQEAAETEVGFVKARMGLGRSSLQPRLLLNQGTPQDDDQADDLDLSASLKVAQAIVDFVISKSHHILDDQADYLSAKLKAAKVFMNCAVSAPILPRVNRNEKVRAHVWVYLYLKKSDVPHTRAAIYLSSASADTLQHVCVCVCVYL